MNWDEQGRRKGLPHGRCKLPKTEIINGKTYCYGNIQYTTKKLLEECKGCMFYIKNVEEKVWQ